MTAQQKIYAAKQRMTRAIEICPHWDYFAWDEHRLECCRERLSAERELRRLQREVTEVEYSRLEVAYGR